MGAADIATKNALKDDDLVKDIINLALPGVLSIDSPLDELDGEETMISFDYTKRKGIDLTLQRLRDVKRGARIVTDGKQDFVIIGVENQTNTDYSMPFRILFENMLDYLQQIRAIIARNRKEDRVLRKKKAERKEKEDLAEAPNASDGAERTPMTFKEYLSGLRKTDRLRPVITIVVYWSDEIWDGPLSLHDMLDIPEELKAYVDNTELHIVQPALLTEEQMDACRSELGLIFRAIVSEDFGKLTQEDNRYQYLSVESANVLEAVLGGMGDVFRQNESEEGVNMTRSMAKLLERTREEGRNEIRAEIKAVNKRIEMYNAQIEAANERTKVAREQMEAANERAKAAEAISTKLKNNRRNTALRLREKGMNESEITELLAATPAEIEEWFAEMR